MRSWVLALLACVACTSVFEQERPPQHFVNQSRAILGNVDFTLFHVPSHGLLRDSQDVDRMRRGAMPGTLVEDLAALLVQGAREPGLTLSVAGGSSAKTVAVLELAFASAGSTRLPWLDLLVLCDPQHVLVVEAAVQRSGCKLRLGDLDG